MRDEEFAEFAAANLLELEQLTGLYTKYRGEVSQIYWDEVRSKIENSIPISYQLSSGNGDISTPGEKRCGWSRVLPIFGQDRDVCICVGVHIRQPSDAESWPYLDGTCWTGVHINLPAVQRNQIWNIATQNQIASERPDGHWPLFTMWEPLANADVTGLHFRLTAANREEGQHEIINQLHLWTECFESIAPSLATTP